MVRGCDSRKTLSGHLMGMDEASRRSHEDMNTLRMETRSACLDRYAYGAEQDCVS